MPYYGASSTDRIGATFVSRIVPTYTTAPAGFKLLATCPPRKAWEISSAWLQNNHATESFEITLHRVPKGYIGPVSDGLLRIFTNILLKPGQLAVFRGDVGLRAGEALWGYQNLAGLLSDTVVPAGINLFIAGIEVG